MLENSCFSGFRCYTCHAVNPPRKIRPQAPPQLNSSLSRSSTLQLSNISSGESSENSDTEASLIPVQQAPNAVPLPASHMFPSHRVPYRPRSVTPEAKAPISNGRNSPMGANVKNDEDLRLNQEKTAKDDIEEEMEINLSNPNVEFVTQESSPNDSIESIELPSST